MKFLKPIWLTLFFLCTYLFGVHAGASPPANSAPVMTLDNPSDCGMHLFLPDNNCPAGQDFLIHVTATPGTQLGVDVVLKEVRLIVAHTWADDIEINLTSPSGEKLTTIISFR